MRRDRDPVGILHRQPRTQQIVIAANDDALRSRFGRNDVQRLARRDAQSTPLSHGEAMDPFVLAQDVTFRIEDLARACDRQRCRARGSKHR